jgi:hypothetical protein
VGPDCAQYLPPVFKYCENPDPPQTIISPPLQTAVCSHRPAAAPLVLVAVQLSVLGSYLPPEFEKQMSPHPPHTITLLPIQTAV